MESFLDGQDLLLRFASSVFILAKCLFTTLLTYNPTGTVPRKNIVSRITKVLRAKALGAVTYNQRYKIIITGPTAIAPIHCSLRTVWNFRANSSLRVSQFSTVLRERLELFRFWSDMIEHGLADESLY